MSNRRNVMMGKEAVTPVGARGQTGMSAVQASAAADPGQADGPIMIEEQSSFAVGGSVSEKPGTYNPLRPTADGQSLYADHAHVFYQRPVNAREYPLVFWHGFGQSRRCWETTPDGRDGFQQLFLRAGYATYLIDQPRRGTAGRSAESVAIQPVFDDKQTFDLFRLGIWPEFFDNVQFSRDPEAFNQMLRQVTPNTGPDDIDVAVAGVCALFDRIGPGILVTHSGGGGHGWLAATRSAQIRAIVSFEPGSDFVFPCDEVPEPVPTGAWTLKGRGVPLDDFRQLTRIPIILYYGDNISEQPDPFWGRSQWRARLAMARAWQAVVNRHGGDVTLVRLPEIGIRGNTHFPFSDLNNREIASLMERYLERYSLNRPATALWHG